jgi:hypothetical protein
MLFKIFVTTTNFTTYEYDKFYFYVQRTQYDTIQRQTENAQRRVVHKERKRAGLDRSMALFSV